MTNEPETTTYEDSDLSTIIETYPLTDARGEEPFTWDTSTSPPTMDTNEDWIVTYDLNAAAADVWEEKAAPLAQDYNYAADGARYDRSNAYEQAKKQARWFRSKRSANTFELEPAPRQDGNQDLVFNRNDPRI